MKKEEENSKSKKVFKLKKSMTIFFFLRGHVLAKVCYFELAEHPVSIKFSFSCLYMDT